MTVDEIKDSVEKTSRAIEQSIGQAPSFFRPRISQSQGDVSGYRFAVPSGVLGYDWTGCHTSVKDRSANMMRDVKNGAVILLYDVQPDPRPALETLDIPELKKGNVFETLSDLFKKTKVKRVPHEDKI
ncbi:MAG TPA: hypothetical protein VF857_07260 [Spirochaetota bacterium]